MRKYEKAKEERFKNKRPDEIGDYYFLDQSARDCHVQLAIEF